MNTLLERAECIDEPFPHCVIHEALPWDLYNELDRTRPPDAAIAAGRTENNTRIDVPTSRLIPAGAWRWFIAYHTGILFWRDILRVFGAHILARFPSIDTEHVSVGVRGTGDYDISTECQIGVNTPCHTRSRVVGPHLDNPKEVYAGLLYMPAKDDPGEGNLQILRYRKPPLFSKQRRLADEYVEVVSTIKYEPNTFVMFINGPDAIHGVTERGPCKQYRRLVNLIGEVRKPLFELNYA